MPSSVSSVYTLQELVDIALQTPEVGAVNFNVLRIVLLKVLSELQLENITATWKPYDAGTYITAILEDHELRDHPIPTEVTEEETSLEVTHTSEMATEPKESVSDKDVIPEISSDESQEDLKPESDTSTDTDKSESSSSKEDEPKAEAEEKQDIVPETTRKKSDSSKSMRAGTILWQIWQMKKAAKRTEALEEIVNSLTSSIDELQEFKASRMKRIMFEEGEQLDSEYRGPTISRQEFEYTIDEIGEALARVTFKQREQKDECNAISQTILKEMCLKASLEDVSKHVGSINKKLRTIGMAVRNIQKLIKDVIYPEACGISKCMACGRQSHLPLRCIVMDAGRKTFKNKREHVERAEMPDKPETQGGLKFTNASLGRMREQMEETQLEVDERRTDQQNKHQERPLFPEYLIQLEPLCPIDAISRDFAPLRRFPDLMRRKTFCVPTIRPKQAPVSISVLEKGIS